MGRYSLFTLRRPTVCKTGGCKAKTNKDFCFFQDQVLMTLLILGSCNVVIWKKPWQCEILKMVVSRKLFAISRIILFCEFECLFPFRKVLSSGLALLGYRWACTITDRLDMPWQVQVFFQCKKHQFAFMATEAQSYLVVMTCHQR